MTFALRRIHNYRNDAKIRNIYFILFGLSKDLFFATKINVVENEKGPTCR